MPTDTYNLLDEWKKSMDLITSPFAIYKINGITRQAVQFIFDTLNDFFQKDYFEIESFQNEKLPKKLLEKNYFLQLLYTPNTINSFESLYDIAALITYSKKLENGIYTKLLTLRGDSNSLRNHLFEVFIYRMFFGNKFYLHLKPNVDGQELEAILQIQNQLILIECKKLYNTEFKRFHYLKNCFDYFFEIWYKKIQLGIFAFIFSPKGNIQSQNDEKVLIQKGIKKYLLLLKEKQTDNFKFEEFNSKGELILHIDKNQAGVFEDYKNSYTNPFAFFLASAPPVMLKDKKNFFHLYQGYNLFISHNDIEKKILDVIRKKRKQHNNSKFHVNIFFFENESSNTGEVPLITKTILNSDLIQDYLLSKNSKDVICVIDKMLFSNQKSEYSMHVYCKKELNYIKQVLENMDLKVFNH